MIGIIIVNYNAFEDTIKCIKSIRKTCNVKYKIYLVDNNSSDKSQSEFICEYGDSEDIELILSKENGGYSKGNNLGIIKAIEDDVDGIIISNPDILFKDNAIDMMYEFNIGKNNLAVVIPKIINIDGSLGNSYIVKKGFYDYFFSKVLPQKIYNRYIKKEVMITKDDMGNYWFKGMGVGACFFIKTDVIKDIGLLDESVFLYYEELILAHKLIEKEYVSVVVNNACVIHSHTKSTANSMSSIGAISVCHSALYYLKKYMNINMIQWFLVALFHVSRYMVRCIFSEDYRRNFKLLVNKVMSTIKVSKEDL